VQKERFSVIAGAFFTQATRWVQLAEAISNQKN
jgi:endonuclease III-like uncharacterized protein